MDAVDNDLKAHVDAETGRNGLWMTSACRPHRSTGHAVPVESRPDVSPARPLLMERPSRTDSELSTALPLSATGFPQVGWRLSTGTTNASARTSGGVPASHARRGYATLGRARTYAHLQRACLSYRIDKSWLSRYAPDRNRTHSHLGVGDTAFSGLVVGKCVNGRYP